MDIRNLNTFIYTAELSSFTKAAERLGYSQSTVSFQIKQLEHELDTQLFERINHTIALTERGREVLHYAQQILRLSQELSETLHEEKAIRGRICLAMADSLCDFLFDDIFVDFHNQHPGIALKIITTGTEEMFRLINHNEADAILTLDNHIYDMEYVIVKEEKVGVHFVAPAGHPLKKASSLSIQELVKEPFILTEKGMSYRRLMDERLAELSLEIHPILELGGVKLICSLVEQGAGISFLPDFVTQPEVDAGRMVYLPVKDFEVHVWKQLLYHRDKWVSPQLESVIRYCGAHL